jgi:hypothetical protein
MLSKRKGLALRLSQLRFLSLYPATQANYQNHDHGSKRQRKNRKQEIGTEETEDQPHQR